MRHLLRISTFALLMGSVLNGPVYAKEVLEGSLNLVGKAPLVLKATDGQMARIGKRSEAQLEIDNKPSFGTETFTLKAAGKKFKFKIPKSAFTGEDTVFTSSAENEQTVSFSSISDRKLVRSWQEMGLQKCTYGGYCRHFDYATGEWVRGVYHSCKGEQDALWEVKAYRRVYTALLTPPSGGQALAQFRAVGPEETERTPLKALSKCNAESGLEGIVGKVTEYPLDPNVARDARETGASKKQLNSDANVDGKAGPGTKTRNAQ